jgi:hypothetical protein
MTSSAAPIPASNWDGMSGELAQDARNIRSDNARITKWKESRRNRPAKNDLIDSGLRSTIRRIGSTL